MVLAGTRIRFVGERQSYRVRASSNRFAVCTKPFNARHTLLYTIIDWQEHIRGTEGLIFPPGYETDEQCAAAIARLMTNRTEVSYRNRVLLEIERMWSPRGVEIHILKTQETAPDRKHD